jgi:dipicolinate synthase subunit B
MDDLLKGLRLGVALCGSFCTFESAIKVIEKLIEKGVEVTPIMSFNAYTISTRFGNIDEFIERIERITGNKIIHTIVDAEPLGPKNKIDAILIAPCTGNTLAKLANGITDTPVLLTAKSLLRNNKIVLLAIATNDGLGINLQNIGKLMPNQNIFFVPFGQDEPIKKPYSLVADLEQVPEALEKALKKEQLQPTVIMYKKSNE